MSQTTSTPFPLGVFTGNPNTPGSSAEATFDADNQAFDSLMGATPIFQNTYIDFTQAPSAWLGNTSWAASVAEASPTFKGSIPVIGLPMGSTSADAPSAQQILLNFANGTYDSMLQGMVKAWASDGFMTQYWRPGVEMNLSSTPGFVGSSAAMQSEWIAAFQHIYTVLHAAAAADGVTMKVIWNPGIANGSAAGNATQTLWPGAQYVDIIGADVYADVYPYGAGTSQGIYDWDKSGQVLNSAHPVYDTSIATWASDPINLEHYYTDPASDQYSLDGSGGSSLSLQNLINFAQSQGKPIAICEAGAGNTGDGAGLSDNPTFVQWLASTLENSSVPVSYVSVWDSNGGGSYEFSQPSDDKPLEAAAWAKYFGAQATTVTPISITPATESLSTDPVSVKPFTGVVITDANAAQTETATVTLSTTANGTLSDPNSATDGSSVTSGVWTVSGSATTVAADLDGLLFTPSASTSTVTTTVTANIKDTAGETASATSTIKATPAVAAHAASPADTQVNGTAGTIYDTAGNAWTVTTGQQIAENGIVIPSSTKVTTLFWTGSALDQLNTSGTWWTQPLNGSAGTELSGPPAGYVAPATPISITPATEAVATTDTASAKPFTGVAISDGNAGQTETAKVTLSATANGKLSDPNASTDGSTVSNGVLTVSGSATAVAQALDGLTFAPTANQVAAGAAVTTTVTAAIKDTAGQSASATSTVTATQVAAPAPAVDTLALQMSEDAWKGDAEFTVSVDGKQVGGDYTASTLHSSGDAGTFLLTGDWGSGVNDVQVGFINDAYGGSSAEDRNLYVNSIAYNGVTYAGTTAALDGDGTTTFAVGGTTATTTGPADTLTLDLSQDAWEGNAEFVLYIDGKTVTTPQSVTALHDQNATQAFTYTGNLGAGTHTIGVAFVNDAYGGSASEDRNLYINGLTLNGASVFSGVKAQDANGTSNFTITTTH
jgi:hypothetical protein